MSTWRLRLKPNNRNRGMIRRRFSSSLLGTRTSNKVSMEQLDESHPVSGQSEHAATSVQSQPTPPAGVREITRHNQAILGQVMDLVTFTTVGVNAMTQAESLRELDRLLLMAKQLKVMVVSISVGAVNQCVHTKIQGEHCIVYLQRKQRSSIRTDTKCGKPSIHR